MKRYAILFDLGNTLVGYYRLPEFPAILDAGIEDVAATLHALGFSLPPSEILTERVRTENHEAGDYCVRPLADRLQRIFGIEAMEQELAMAVCRAFMQPIFDCARVYDDTLPTLRQLRSRGIRTAVVSNSPWGSPASLWLEELDRLGITSLIDEAIFCGDVGWRKPDRRIFDHALQRLDVTADRALFVGDDPRWDIVGPQGVGMEAVLIERETKSQAGTIGALTEVVEMVAGYRSEVKR